MLKLIINECDYITASISGITQKLVPDSMSDKMLDSLRRYDIMRGASCKDERNPHLEYVLKYFSPFDGYYVMPLVTADALAKTGRNMEDVFVYDYSRDCAILRNYANRKQVL